ncbi:MAG TPA: J domain-containing protein [Spirochaetota bacterium]|nr:J domain-containing protein [Spirochaetota bacterium]HPI90829.1 J domain-containing protein [Spirochaetota bacterium]HPR47624.1 J domain-containing protein [Spirochaetota bacterium]
MQIAQCYEFLNISPASTDDEISAMYKKLALQYHPDRNRERLEWAHEKMTVLNFAYSTVMSHRFTNAPRPDEKRRETAEKRPAPEPVKKPRKPVDEQLEKITRESMIKTFIKIRESVNDSLYRFFQFNLYNQIRREEVFNRGIFNEIVFNLRKSYHAIKKLHEQTKDDDIRRHMDVFNSMIFNFYKASECLNIIDSYSDLYDVQAYRQYKNADELLHQAQKELFYDRHNRGNPKIEYALSHIIQSQKIFKSVLALFADSSWAVETKIKLAYATSLREYVELFFIEEE